MVKKQCKTISSKSSCVWHRGSRLFAVEALARSGIGHLTLIDGDVVNKTNINRQLIATTETIGKYKTEVMKQRIQQLMQMQ